MPKLRAHNFSVSLDGYAAGPAQSIDDPLGVGGEALHNWAFGTRTFRELFGEEGGDEGIDDRLRPQVKWAWARRSWAATCSDPSGVIGPTMSGRAGGARIRRTTIRPSSSPIIPASRSRWRVGPSSTS
jgi:hypothetical protein